MVAALAIAVYLPVMRHGYTLMDDQGLIAENYSLIGNIGNVINAFKTDAFGSNGALYRPLLTVSLMLDALYSGQNAWGYHLTNILLHALSCCLLFYLLISLKYSARDSFISAAIFSVHPVLTQAVAWIPGRNDILLTVWVLGAFLSWIRCLEGRRNLWLALHLISGLLAVLAKETALLLPVLLLWFAWLRNRTAFPKSAFKAAAGWLVIGVLWLFMKMAAAPGAGETTVNRLPEIVSGLLGYIGKIVIPLKFAAIPVPRDTSLAIGLAGVVILAAGIFAGLKDRRSFLFGAGWFLLFLAPNFFSSTDYANFMEHRLYLPLIGFIIMLLELKVWGVLIKRPAIFYGSFSIALILLGVRTVAHAENFRDPKIFWEYAVKSSPSLYYVHDMQGRLFLQDGRLKEAGSAFEKAVALKGDYPHGHNDLGVVQMSQGRYREAEIGFARALEIDPSFRDARMNLGTLYLELGDLDHARACFVQMLEYQPDDHQALNNLGIVYYRQNMPDSALIYLNRALAIDPGNGSYRANLRAVKINAVRD
jgi:Flp pilus assembly protein TadD